MKRNGLKVYKKDLEGCRRSVVCDFYKSILLRRVVIYLHGKV